MKRFELSFPDLAVLAATRGMAGAGIGLLLGDRLTRDARKAIGWTLFLLGAFSTIPILLNLLAKRRRTVL